MMRLLLQHRRSQAISALRYPIATLVVVTGFAWFGLSSASAAAGIYRPINYQGKLASTGGIAIANGQYNMRFKIFTAPTGGVAAWTETWDDNTTRITSTGGLFSIALGTHVTMTGSVDFNSDALYLQIEFDPGNDDVYEEVFAPRRRFASVPYAHNARLLEGLGSAKFARKDQAETLSGTITIKPNDASKTGLEILSTAGVLGTGGLKISTKGASHILFGTGGIYDVRLYRSASGTLKTNAALQVVGNLSGSRLVISNNANISGALLVLSNIATRGTLSSSGTLFTESGAYFDGTTMVIQAGSNRVGIGTASPNAKLEIRGNSSELLRIYSDGAGDANTTYYGEDDNLRGRIKVENDDNTFQVLGTQSTNLKLGANDTVHVTINTSGLVGIGTATPRAKLEVAGSISGSSLFVQTLSGAGLTDCDAASQVLKWDATNETFSCGADLSAGTFGTGNVLTISDARYLKLSGGTLTGVTTVDITSGNFNTVGLKIINTLSGAHLHAERTLSSSGTLSVEGSSVFQTTTDSLTAFQILDADGGGVTFDVDTINERIGIGTTSPDVRLDVKIDSTAASAIQFQTSTEAVRGAIYVDESSNIVSFGSTTNSDVGLYKFAGDAGFILKTSGNVGIGTLTPAGKLVVAGSGTFLGTISGRVLVANSAAISGALLVKSSITSKGSVSGSTLVGFGLGDCSDSAKKVVYNNSTNQFSCATDLNNGGAGTPEIGTDAFTGGVLRIATNRFVDVSGDTMTGVLIINDSGSSSGGVLLNVAGTMSGRGLRIAGTGGSIEPLIATNISTGRVGIGTSSPVAHLHVSGAVAIGVTTVGNFSPSDSALDVYAPGKFVNIDSNIGGAWGLQIRGISAGSFVNTATFTANGSTGEIRIGSAAATYFPTLYAGNAEIVRITTAGLVGIGTTVPEAKLEVVGTLSGSRLVISNNANISGSLVVGRTGDFNTVGLKVLNTISGAQLHTEKTLTTSGALVAERSMDIGSGSLFQPVYRTDDGLVGHWSFSETGSTTVYDRSPYGNDGTTSGSTFYTAAKFGQGYRFTGVNSVAVGTPSSLQPTAAVSMSMWVNPVANPASFYALGGMMPYGTARGYGFDMTTSISTFRIGNDTWGAANGPKLSLNQWTHIAGTWDGATVRYYINGVEAANTEKTSITYTATSFALGKYGGESGGAANRFNGKMDDVRVYNRALTPDEIRTMYLGVGADNAMISDAFRILSTGNNLLLKLTSSDMTLEMIGTLSGRKLFANRSLATSGTLVVKSRDIVGSGALTVVPAESQTGAFLYGSGATALAIDVYTKTGTTTPQIQFGYRGTFDVGLYRTGGTNSGAFAIRVTNTKGGSTQSAFEIYSNDSHANNRVFRVEPGGVTRADGAYNSSGADYAEWFYSGDKTLKPGDVVCIDVLRPNTVKRCERGADPNLMGIVSTNPAFVGNSIGGADGMSDYSDHTLVGLIGQVPAKVDLTGGPVRPGDSLTSSVTPGFARRAQAGESTVGVALESYDDSKISFDGNGRAYAVINVLISRRNQSLTVETVEQKVLDSIASMNISDEVSRLVQTASDQLNVDARISSAVTTQLQTLDLAPTVNALIDRRLSGAILHSDGFETSDLRLEFSAAQSGMTVLMSQISSLASRIERLESHVLSGSLRFGSGQALHAAAATFSGLTVLGSHASIGPISVSGSAVEIGSLMSTGSLKILGNITVTGLAQFFGNVEVRGELSVSGKQAGIAVIPQGATEVVVTFSGAFLHTPIVTATSDDFGAFRIRNRSQTGFTIQIKDPAEVVVTFTWLALSSENPSTTEGGEPMTGVTPFPVNEYGNPLSTDLIWNSCIRGTPVMLASGEPVSCARYHDGYAWQHPDLGIFFTYNPNHEPPILTLPEGYAAEVVTGEESEGSEEVEASENETEETEETNETEEDSSSSASSESSVSSSENSSSSSASSESSSESSSVSSHSSVSSVSSSESSSSVSSSASPALSSSNGSDSTVPATSSSAASEPVPSEPAPEEAPPPVESADPAPAPTE